MLAASEVLAALVNAVDGTAASVDEDHDGQDAEHRHVVIIGIEFLKHKLRYISIKKCAVVSS